MTAATLAGQLLDYDFGGHRIADATTSATLRGLQNAMRSHARAPASDLISATESMLRGIAELCARPDWDGAGAKAVTVATERNVERLLRALYALLPSSVPLPDIVPDADGDLSLTWQASSDRLFSISVAEDGGLVFASRLAGDVEFHGKAKLDSTPEAILRSLGATIAGLFAGASPSS